MTNVTFTAVLVFGLGVSTCGTEEVSTASSPKASLKASLSGDTANPVLHIRLRNIGDVSIMVDKELVFLPNIMLVDNEQHIIPFKESRPDKKPTVSVLKSRLVTLKPGEEIERQVHLRKGFKRFVTGIGTPIQPGGGEAPKVTVYETFCQIPADTRTFEIEVSYKPWYSFEEGFSQYLEGISVVQFYRGPLRASVPYRLGQGTRERQDRHPATTEDSPN